MKSSLVRFVPVLLLSMILGAAFSVHASTGSPQIVSGAVTAFVIITPQQNIPVGALSHPITIQSQNVNFTATSISETCDLSPISSSRTGMFVNSSGKKLSTTTTMSKNTANRSFYYSDTTAGNFLLTVGVMCRQSQKTFSVSQHILIGQNITPSSPIVKPVTKPILKTETKPVSISIPVSSVSEHASSSSPSTHVERISTSTLSSSSEQPNVAEVFTAPHQSGFITTLFAWPIRIVDFLHRLFIGND